MFHVRSISRTRKIGLLGVLAVVFTSLLPWRVAVAQGRSMEPTLHNGQPFAYERWDPATQHAHRGDVVLVRAEGQLCVKRVLAVGGDRFWALGHGMEGLAAAFILPVHANVSPWKRRFRGTLTALEVRVPRGHLFVMGDNAFSRDSRHYGPVPESQVVGKVLLPDDDPDESLSRVTWSGPPPVPHGRRS